MMLATQGAWHAEAADVLAAWLRYTVLYLFKHPYNTVIFSPKCSHTHTHKGSLLDHECEVWVRFRNSLSDLVIIMLYAMLPETCEYWLALVKSCIYYAHQTCGICQVLPYWWDFKAQWELWNPLSKKTALSQCSFIWNKGPGNIDNDHKAQEKLVHRTCKYFSEFLTLSSSWYM